MKFLLYFGIYELVAWIYNGNQTRQAVATGTPPQLLPLDLLSRFMGPSGIGTPITPPPQQTINLPGGFQVTIPTNPAGTGPGYGSQPTMMPLPALPLLRPGAFSPQPATYQLPVQ